MAESTSDSLESVLEKVKRQVSFGDYNEALMNLRKITHYMIKWIVWNEGLWDEARTNQEGKMYDAPTFYQCIRILRIKKKMDKRERLMFEGVQEYGNESAHEENFQKAQAEYYCSIVEEYMPDFLKRFPKATALSILPDKSSPQKKPEQNKESKSFNEVFGCDIGNGFGFISMLQNVAYDPIPMFPSKYHLNANGMPTSAYVAPPDGKVIEVFSDRAAASKYQKSGSEQIIHAVKTRLKEGELTISGISSAVSAYSLYAAIARDLIKLGNEERKNRGEKPVYDIVFTFPASFADDIDVLNMMQKSIENISFNGKKINVVGRLPEPAAVAIDYLNYMQNIAHENIRIKKDNFTALVYDLGHGTFDTAVVTANSKGQPYKMHIYDGLPEVGGKNFDLVIYDEICRILREQYDYVPNSSNAREAIKISASNMKHELSDNRVSSCQIFVNGGYVDVEITRERFEQLSRYLIMQTFELVEKVIERAHQQNISIDAVVLSGGASLMPMVSSGLKSMLAEENIPIVKYRPSEAVSYGAARFGYGRTKPQTMPKDDKSSRVKKDTHSTEQPSPILEQLTQHGYGIWIPSEENLLGKVQFMIKSKTSLGTESKQISLVSPSSRFELRVFRSNSKDLKQDFANVEKCTEIIRIPFEAKPNETVRISMNVLEDYNIRITCRTESGKVSVKSTSDKISELV